MDSVNNTTPTGPSSSTVSLPISTSSSTEISSSTPQPPTSSPSTTPPTTSSPTPTSTSSTPPPPPTSTTPTSSSVSVSTSTFTTSVAPGSTTTAIVTSTVSPTDTTPVTSSTDTTSTSSGTPAPGLAGSDESSGGGGGGLNDAGRIAIATVIPILGVALIVLAGLWFWKKRRARHDAEELRRKEMEEYGFNPNNDPTLPAVGGSSANGDEISTMREQDAGYRGWGTTSSATRKASTTMSSNPGMALSDGGGNAYRNQGSPTGNMTVSDHQSGDPLVRGGEEGTGALTTGAAVEGAAAGAAGGTRGVNRGPSNASSAYSGGNRSEVSALSDGPLPSGSPPYPQDYMYPEENQQGNWDGQPVIRDVSARRNTRIENPTVVPQQGNAGISQNF